MKKNTLFAVVGTAAIAASAWYISHLRAPETNVGTPPLFPELGARVNEVKRLEIESRTHKTVLVSDGETWVLENRDRYPARFEDVKRSILAVAELKIIEAKTKLPEMYSHISVEDVTGEQSASTQVTLKDAAGTALAAIIVGKERAAAASGPIKAARYVRKGGDAQSYLVAGELNLSADPLAWTDQQLFSIPASRIRAVSIATPGKPEVNLARAKAADIDFALQAMPDGFKTKSNATVTSLAAALEDTRFDDVRAAAGVQWPADTTVTTLRGFDGLVVTVKTANIDNRQYARFEFAFDPAGVNAEEAAAVKQEQAIPELPLPGTDTDAVAPPAAEKEEKQSVEDEVKALNERMQNWVYVLPDFKQSMLTRGMDDLIVKQEAPKPPAAMPPPPDPLKVEHFDAEGNPIAPPASESPVVMPPIGDMPPPPAPMPPDAGAAGAVPEDAGMASPPAAAAPDPASAIDAIEKTDALPADPAAPAPTEQQGQ